MTGKVVVAPSAVITVPDGWTSNTVVGLEPLGVALHAIDLANPRLGETVGVIGCGPIGLLIIQLLSAAGISKVHAVDPLEYVIVTPIVCVGVLFAGAHYNVN